MFVYFQNERQIQCSYAWISSEWSNSWGGDPGGGDSEREAESSALNLTPTVLDTVGSVGKAVLLGHNHGRKKSSRSTLTSLENSGLPSVVVQGLRGSPYSVYECMMLARMETRGTWCRHGTSTWRSLSRILWGCLVKVEEDSSLHRLCPRLRAAHYVSWVATFK